MEDKFAILIGNDSTTFMNVKGAKKNDDDMVELTLNDGHPPKKISVPSNMAVITEGLTLEEVHSLSGRLNGGKNAFHFTLSDDHDKNLDEMLTDDPKIEKDKTRTLSSNIF